jgi:hypothetical protein
MPAGSSPTVATTSPVNCYECRSSLIILDCVGALEDASWTLLLVLRRESATVAIPLILCTGSGRDVELLPPHLTVMGISVVIKPFTMNQLCEAIHERLFAA